MQKLMLSVVALLAVAAASGCNNAKSPDTVANDVAAAQAKRASEVADAKKEAAKDSNKAEAKVDDKNSDLDNVNAKGSYDVAMARRMVITKWLCRNATPCPVTRRRLARIKPTRNTICQSQCEGDARRAKAVRRFAGRPGR